MIKGQIDSELTITTQLGLSFSGGQQRSLGIKSNEAFSLLRQQWPEGQKHKGHLFNV